MVSGKSFLLVGLLAAACLTQFTQSLSIPPPPTEIQVRDNSTNNGFGGDLAKEPTSDEDAALEQSSKMNKEGKRDTEEEPATDLMPPKSRSNADGEFTNKIEATTTNPVDSDSTEGDSSPNLDESLPLKPVMEVVELVLRPFKPPSILVLDFFKNPNATSSSNNNGTSGSSSENDSGSASSSSSSLENNKEPDSPSSEGKDDKDEGNEEEDDDENSAEITPSTTSRPSRFQKKTKVINSNERRRKRETHQMGDNSKKDDDSGSSSASTTPSANKGNNNSTTGGDDDDIASPVDISGSDENDNGEDDNGQQSLNTTTTGKSGTVRIFLEILQLVPLSTNSSSGTSTSDDDDDGGDSTTTAEADPTSTSSPPKDANSNKGISSSTETTLRFGASHTRVLRSAVEKKGDPSQSPMESATPSSGKSSKPPMDAPSGHLPSTNGPQGSTAAPDKNEGPPLLNVIVKENDD